MNTGHSFNVVGQHGLAGNAWGHPNCRIGRTFVRGYASKKFRLPSSLLALLIVGPFSSEWATINGRVVAFLMSLDTRLAQSWESKWMQEVQMDAKNLSIINQKRSVEG